MAPFDAPALAAAQLRARPGQRNGWRERSQATNPYVRHPAERSRQAQSMRVPSLLGQRANVVFTTCDVDFAAPVVQEAINRGILAVAPCIGTDQMGPKRFGAKGTCVQLRQRRTGRGIGDGAVRVGPGMEDGSARDGHATSSTSRTSSRRSRHVSSSSAARSSTRRRTSRSAATTSRTRSAAERRQGGRSRDVDPARSARCRR